VIDFLQIIAPVINREGSVDSNGCFTPSFYWTVLDGLKNVVKTVHPTRLICIAEDGEPPFAKVDESRRRVFERLRAGRDAPATF
jgi:5'-3' exonuclease